MSLLARIRSDMQGVGCRSSRGSGATLSRWHVAPHAYEARHGSGCSFARPLEQGDIHPLAWCAARVGRATCRAHIGDEHENCRFGSSQAVGDLFAAETRDYAGAGKGARHKGVPVVQAAEDWHRGQLKGMWRLVSERARARRTQDRSSRDAIRDELRTLSHHTAHRAPRRDCLPMLAHCNFTVRCSACAVRRS